MSVFVLSDETEENREFFSHVLQHVYIYIYHILYALPVYIAITIVNLPTFHITLRMCIESHTFHYLSLWLRYYMEEFVKHSVEKVILHLSL